MDGLRHCFSHMNHVYIISIIPMKDDESGKMGIPQVMALSNPTFSYLFTIPQPSFPTTTQLVPKKLVGNLKLTRFCFNMSKKSHQDFSMENPQVMPRKIISWCHLLPLHLAHELLAAHVSYLTTEAAFLDRMDVTKKCCLS